VKETIEPSLEEEETPETTEHVHDLVCYALIYFSYVESSTSDKIQGTTGRCVGMDPV
jgi:hypothetical protein